MNEEKVQKGVGSSESSTDPAGETADGTPCRAISQGSQRPFASELFAL